MDLTAKQLAGSDTNVPDAREFLNQRNHIWSHGLGHVTFYFKPNLMPELKVSYFKRHTPRCQLMQMVLLAVDINLTVADLNLIDSDGLLNGSSQWETIISVRNLPSASSPDDEHIRFCL